MNNLKNNNTNSENTDNIELTSLALTSVFIGLDASILTIESRNKFLSGG